MRCTFNDGILHVSIEFCEVRQIACYTHDETSVLFRILLRSTQCGVIDNVDLDVLTAFLEECLRLVSLS